MKCFDVVNTVLQATYDEISDKKPGRDARIAEALDVTSAQYANKLMKEGGPDFSDPATRFGYVFRYVPAHAHWIYELISESKAARAVFEEGKARVTCLGGGPGSDVVGMLKYLDENDISCKLFVELIDGCEAWKATWSDLAYQIEWDDGLHTDYVIHDVGDHESWESPSKIEKADLITVSFFASEVFHLDTAKDYLATMLGRAKSGALVLVIDNRTSEVYRMMDSIASDAGYETLLADEGTAKIYDSGERLDIVKDFADKFGKKSRLTGNVFRRVYRKK
jgi:hypothetical protein